MWCPGRGLNGAVADGVAALAARGVERAIVAHADLPLATRLDWVADFPGVTLVPDRHRDGTNVAAVPTDAGFRFAYGGGSFARHRAEAARLGLAARLVRDPFLAWDVDLPADLAWPGADVAAPCELGGRRHVTTSSAPIDGGDLPVPSRALAIGAHPDDIEFGCRRHAGQVGRGRLRRQPPGVHRRVQGHAGTPSRTSPSWSPCARTSSGLPPALGATGEVVFLGWSTASSSSGVRQRWQVAYWIRRLRPDVVLGHDPWKRYRLHPDHRHAGFLTVDGVVAARDPHFFPEQALAPTGPRRCCCSRPTSPTTSSRSVEADVARKVAALEAHPASCARPWGSRWAHPRRASRWPPSTSGSRLA